MRLASNHKILEDLPGADRIAKGLNDVSLGLTSIESCLVEIARPRLERVGLLKNAPHLLDRELTLYNLLSKEPGASHSRFNALLRELVSFEHALDHRLRQNGEKASWTAAKDGQHRTGSPFTEFQTE